MPATTGAHDNDEVGMAPVNGTGQSHSLPQSSPATTAGSSPASGVPAGGVPYPDPQAPQYGPFHTAAHPTSGGAAWTAEPTSGGAPWTAAPTSGAGPTSAPPNWSAATPTSGPGNPVSGPGSPVSAPGSPVSGAGSPVPGPGYPVSAPGSPVSGPGYPVSAPGNPVSSPGNPVSGAGGGPGNDYGVASAGTDEYGLPIGGSSPFGAGSNAPPDADYGSNRFGAATGSPADPYARGGAATGSPADPYPRGGPADPHARQGGHADPYPRGASDADRFGFEGAPSYSGPRIEPTPKQPKSRFIIPALAGLVAGLLIFGTAGWFAGRATAPDPSPAGTTVAGPAPSTSPSLRVYEQNQVAINQPKFTGSLATVAQGWLPHLSGCTGNGDKGGPKLGKSEKARVRCEMDAMSVIFVEYATTADRDKARVTTLGQNVDARTLTPGVGAAVERATPSGRTNGNYVEYAYKVSGRTVAGIWWDDAATPVAAYLLAYWKEGAGEKWEPMRDIWARYA
ncbi:hypothetical protein COUCH_08735 [Couchioplanes caeruleus]|uniref:hypothetical protein n=1 Tax=Couchioplanes caeruleus TaxID=56438 RepID=UPI0020BF3459|nr:hypothetical protein [Couchioplanes caeruleus]UQU66341.1 hypothetical protein COUCH_08735 [Couchioplanes caeruleus]